MMTLVAKIQNLIASQSKMVNELVSERDAAVKANARITEDRDRIANERNDALRRITELEEELADWHRMAHAALEPQPEPEPAPHHRTRRTASGGGGGGEK